MSWHSRLAANWSPNELIIALPFKDFKIDVNNIPNSGFGKAHNWLIVDAHASYVNNSASSLNSLGRYLFKANFAHVLKNLVKIGLIPALVA